MNAKAAADPFDLYNPSSVFAKGGITRSGSSGSYVYTLIAGRENKPVNDVTFFDAVRFANWMSNGQGSGDTETGAYTLLGGTATSSNGSTLTRNPGATIVLPTENEWYKAAYYDASSSSYFDYPAGSNTPTTCSGPSATPNTANCNHGSTTDLTSGGSYTGSASPYGTYDQGGNVWEWTESIACGNGCRIARGGSWSETNTLGAWSPLSAAPSHEDSSTGFRLVMIPEPGTGLLVIAGLLGLASWRRVHTS